MIYEGRFTIFWNDVERTNTKGRVNLSALIKYVTQRRGSCNSYQSALWEMFGYKNISVIRVNINRNNTNAQSPIKADKKKTSRYKVNIIFPMRFWSLWPTNKLNNSYHTQVTLVIILKGQDTEVRSTVEDKHKSNCMGTAKHIILTFCVSCTDETEIAPKA